MMLMNRFARLKPGMVCIIALCVLVPTVILPATYYAQTQGVCLKAGRVLSEEELRKAVLINTVNNVLELAFHNNLKIDNDDFWINVAINSPAQETDLQKLIDASYSNGKSIEKNFGLTTLLEGRNKGIFSSSQLFEPFILMTYEHRADGNVTFFVSSYVSEVLFSYLDAKHKEAAIREMTVYKKLLGYGNHYFHFYPPPLFLSFRRECCDNKGQDSKDYLDKKQAAYKEALFSIAEDAATRSATFSSTIATVSNCGDILMAAKHNTIHWLGNQFEDEDWP
jgi:hypothetical protein